MAKDVKEITKKLEEGVKRVFESGKYEEYLKCMGKFHDYSANNIMLIMLQKPEASLVAGYKAWQTKFGRQVRKGEKGIKILAPLPRKYIKEVADEYGNISEEEFSYTSFRATTVFDVSQTEGNELPEIAKQLSGDGEEQRKMIGKLIAISPVPVEFENINSGANGYFSSSGKKIVVKDSLSDTHKVKTLIHEISHAMLHDKDAEQESARRNEREVQAESVAFIVCDYFGFDTSEYSFGYIAGWSEDKKVKELSNSMEVIRKTAKEIIGKVA